MSKQLHSMLALSKLWHVDRQRLRGLVEGMDLLTYEGSRNSIAVDDDGKARLAERLGIRADGPSLLRA